MVGGVINVTAAAIDEAVCATIVSKVIDIGFVVIRWREFLFAIVKVVAADHRAERCMRIEIPFGKIATSFLLVEPFAFAFGNVI
jgi:hypothetical protein